MKERKYIILLQPEDFDDNRNILKTIVLMDMRGKIIINDSFNAHTYLKLRKILIDESVKLITYNYNMLWSLIYTYFRIDLQDNKVIDLMSEFAEIYGQLPEWVDNIDSWEYPVHYTWQKMSTCLGYYKVKNNNVDIYNPVDVVKKTLTIYRHMYNPNSL